MIEFLTFGLVDTTTTFGSNVQWFCMAVGAIAVFMAFPLTVYAHKELEHDEALERDFSAMCKQIKKLEKRAKKLKKISKKSEC